MEINIYKQTLMLHSRTLVVSGHILLGPLTCPPQMDFMNPPLVCEIFLMQFFYSLYIKMLSQSFKFIHVYK